MRAEPPEPSPVLRAGFDPGSDATAGDRVEDLLDLRAALCTLAPRRRATVVLRYYCDYSVEQTARLLGCTPGTVKSQTAKALAQLRDVLEPCDAGGRAEDARGEHPLAVPKPSYHVEPTLPGRTQ